MQRFGYCERLGPEFWAEPWNATTNLAFLVAAVAALRLWRSEGRRDWPALALIALVFAIGIGSFLFHTMPQRWTLLADVVPIQLFAFSYFGLALSRFLHLRLPAVLLGTLAFFGFAVAISAGLGPLLPQPWRGAAGYAAFLLGLIGMTAALWRDADQARTAALIGRAGLVFALSLTARTLDGALCDPLAIGSHWLWHLLNALVLYLLLRAAIQTPPPRAA